MADIFSGIFDDLRSGAETVGEFFDMGLKRIVSGKSITERSGKTKSGSDMSSLAESAFVNFGSGTKTTIGLGEGQVSLSPRSNAAESESVKSVDMEEFRRDWIVRMQEYGMEE